ncbi:integrase zinc binding domain-containing protein, partial [Klebsiella pneumoniae]|uniref:integrase zinc binding domain-containing protein n=1 Tax=Klebsiella pneumoniae TaxID=573 RepID=UPI0040556EF4
MSYCSRHPILLPKNHPFTDLIVDHAHIANLHSGPSATHSYIRQNYWILDGANVVRRRLSKCNKCFSVKPVPIIQPMGYLPPERVTATYAFMTTGVDYAGPFDVSSARIVR